MKIEALKVGDKISYLEDTTAVFTIVQIAGNEIKVQKEVGHGIFTLYPDEIFATMAEAYDARHNQKLYGFITYLIPREAT